MGGFVQGLQPPEAEGVWDRGSLKICRRFNNILEHPPPLSPFMPVAMQSASLAGQRKNLGRFSKGL